MKAVVRIVGGGLVMLFAFTAIYVAAFHAPRAKGFDVGVVGTPADATQLQSALDGEDRGAFDVRGYDTERDARTALLDRTGHPGALTSDSRLVRTGHPGAGALTSDSRLVRRNRRCDPWLRPASSSA